MHRIRYSVASRLALKLLLLAVLVHEKWSSAVPAFGALPLRPWHAGYRDGLVGPCLS
jgi:hypothetical protein